MLRGRAGGLTADSPPRRDTSTPRSGRQRARARPRRSRGTRRGLQSCRVDVRNVDHRLALPASDRRPNPAELYHPDGATTWTWDGRDTPFPSNVLDFQFYSPAQLEMIGSGILDVETLPAKDVEALGLTVESLKRTGRHRPLLVKNAWR